MQKEIIEFNQLQRSQKKLPQFQAGDVVKIHRKIKEGEKERIQIFEGVIIAIKGKQSSSPMITVRKVSSGVGVELILPILSPNIEKIELIKRAKVRRAKLYHIRNVSAKKSRMKYKDISEYIAKAEEPAVSEETEEKKSE
ncbi:MAG: 50S ribosomal protein L19 [Candidatus Moranbacteria bacterium]|nr:50S ribosomal protein L19 [Candidatus Moranbacteria bacterium]